MSEESEREPVGSVAEEAVKLLGALQGWAKENAQDASGAAAGASSIFATFHEHIANGGEECRYCPVCQLISVAREVSPEVKQHLSSAAASLLQAFGAALSGAGADNRGRTDGPLEKIDLSDEDWQH